MLLNSERVSLIPLNIEALQLALEDYQALGNLLGASVTTGSLDDEMQYAMTVRLKKASEDPINYKWLTNWAVILKSENMIIGYVMIKGCPNNQGEVIIGYGIEEAYRGNGYATEAIKGLKEWIFSHEEAISIIGDTEKDNIASHNVLIKSGAQKYKENEDLIWWRIGRRGCSSSL